LSPFKELKKFRMKQMRVIFKRAIVVLLFFSFQLHSQTLPKCVDSLIYYVAGPVVYKYNPSLPFSSTNPSTLIPSGGGQGLALGNNINGGPSPTFYNLIGGFYNYWNGTSWVSTTHSAGTPNALNIAVGGCYIYNLVGSTGDVYRYDGTGNGTLLTTITGFSGGGPYDLAADVEGNFYILKTTTITPQYLRMYSSAGALLNSFSLTGIPNGVAGGGFAVIENYVYALTNSGFYKGTISGSAVNFTFTAPTSSLPGASDLANCPTLKAGTPINYNFSNSGLSCATNTGSVNASGWPSGTTYTWSGPGLSGPINNSSASCSLTGSYNCTITAPGNCPLVLTTSVATSGTFATSVIASNTIVCSGGSVQMLASGGSSYTWAPASSLSSSNGTLVTANPTVTTTYTVMASGSGSCTPSPNTITINVTTCAGINSLFSDSGIRIYPNPNNGEFIIRSEKELNARLSDQLGRLVSEIKLGEENNYEFNTYGLPGGIYFLTGTEPGKHFVHKIVVIGN